MWSILYIHFLLNQKTNQKNQGQKNTNALFKNDLFSNNMS